MFNTDPKNKKDKGSIQLAKRIGGKRFATISEIDSEGDEHFLGRGGSVNLINGDVVVVSNGTETFRVTQRSFRAAELMSGNGVRMHGYNREGVRRSVIAIYTKM